MAYNYKLCSDCYEYLRDTWDIDCPKDCDVEAAKKKMRKIMLQNHPDKHPGEENKYTPIFQRIADCNDRVIKDRCIRPSTPIWSTRGSGNFNSSTRGSGNFHWSRAAPRRRSRSRRAAPRRSSRSRRAAPRRRSRSRRAAPRRRSRSPRRKKASTRGCPAGYVRSPTGRCIKRGGAAYKKYFG